MSEWATRTRWRSGASTVTKRGGNRPRVPPISPNAWVAPSVVSLPAQVPTPSLTHTQADGWAIPDPVRPVGIVEQPLVTAIIDPKPDAVPTSLWVPSPSWSSGAVPPPKLIVEITDGSSEATASFRTKDEVLTKTIAIADLLAELSRDMEITTGILPSGTKFYAGTKNAYRIGVQVPAKARTAEFRLHEYGLRTMTVPFPEILFAFSVNEQRITHSKLFACIPPVGRSYDRLYRFPFGNVYENGDICWGGNTHPHIAEPIVLDAVFNKFFASVFSGHLVHGTNMFHPPEGVVNLRTLLEHLEGQEHFPDRVLKTSDVTLGMAMSSQGRR